MSFAHGLRQELGILMGYIFGKKKLLSHQFLLRIVYMCQKSVDSADAFNCYKK